VSPFIPGPGGRLHLVEKHVVEHPSILADAAIGGEVRASRASLTSPVPAAAHHQMLMNIQMFMPCATGVLWEPIAMM
jgi:hypothetical protein